MTGKNRKTCALCVSGFSVFASLVFLLSVFSCGTFAFENDHVREVFRGNNANCKTGAYFSQDPQVLEKMVDDAPPEGVEKRKNKRYQRNGTGPEFFTMEKTTFENISVPDESDGNTVFALLCGGWRGGAQVRIGRVHRENGILIVESSERLDESSGGDGNPWVLVAGPKALFENTEKVEFRTTVDESYEASPIGGNVKEAKDA